VYSVEIKEKKRKEYYRQQKKTRKVSKRDRSTD